MNLANKLTLSRIFMIPIFIYFLQLNTDNGILISGVVFILASITDFFDGYIARSRNMVTKFGKFMDPLADKLLVISAFIYFVALGMVPAWAVILIISRELIVSIFRAIAAADGVVIAAGSLGKFKTVSQMITIISYCLLPLYRDYVLFPLPLILFYICTFFTILSGIDYIVRNKNVLKDVN
ncbi:MAG: CDP-diacylglycerol--glycerol-3-phosphate 3-phosphatidyltransferase [Spirochaetales bacterium]|nr:CDP-diacylglycerol--glycerol-3-phosphate 3-phosphatidyltransferase [Spirochaetales bacterium]